MINMSGIHLLNFQKILQSLDGANYDKVADFVIDVQCMLQGVAEEFGFFGPHVRNQALMPPSAAIRPLPLSQSSPISSSFIASVSSPHQGVGWNSSQMSQQQSQLEQLAVWQQNNRGMMASIPGIHHSQLPQHLGFTEQQLIVLNAQTYAFHELKKGAWHLSEDILQAITPPPLESHPQQFFHHASGAIDRDRFASKGVQYAGNAETEKVAVSSAYVQKVTTAMKEPVRVEFLGKREQQKTSFSTNPEQIIGCQTLPTTRDTMLDKGKNVVPEIDLSDAIRDMESALERSMSNPIVLDAYRETAGPIPFFIGSTGSSGNMSPAYDMEDLLFGEGGEVLYREGAENLELEEGEIAVAGESCLDNQQPGSWFRGHEDGETEEVLQKKFERKRSGQIQPGYSFERDNVNPELPSFGCGVSFPMVSVENHENEEQFGTISMLENFRDPVAIEHHQSGSTSTPKPILASTMVASSPILAVSPYPSHLASLAIGLDNDATGATEPPRETRDINALNASRPSFSETEMSDAIRRECKRVILEIERLMDEEGHQIIPHLADVRRRSENSCYMINMSGIRLLNFQKILQCLDGASYDKLGDFVVDVQCMLQGVGEEFGFSHEVKSEVETVGRMFFTIMKKTFPDIDID